MHSIHKFSISFLFMISCLLLSYVDAQIYLKGSYVRSDVAFEGSKFVIYNFSRKKNSRGTVKAKYFAKNANQQFATWKNGKDILFYCSGAFSKTWDSDSPPLGICVDNGKIVNRNIDNRMDGLVIVYNGGKQAGGIAVINIEKESVTVNQGGKEVFNLRNSEHRVRFLKWAESQNATVFQTQLLYTKTHGYCFPTYQLTYGNRAERRFLAICKRGDTVFHIVVDYPESDYLNRSAQKVIRYLSENLGYQIFGLFNLDTGGKNIMRAYNDNGQELARGPQDSNNATNLLIYYVD